MANKLAEGQFANLEEQLSNLAREAGFSPQASPTGMKTSRAPPATTNRLADWRHVAFGGSLLAASIGFAAWWWSSSADRAVTAPSAPIALTRAEAAAPKDAASAGVAPSAALAEQLQPVAHDLAALRQTVEQLTARQEQLVRDNENLTSQLAAGREEMARNNGVIDQIKATQIQMARESQTLTERLNASQQQLARIIAAASELNAVPEEPKMKPEEPKVMPDTPLPRPRQPANVAPTQKPAPGQVRPQAKNPQPAVAWPWSPRSPQ
ncbi:hypothetical protein LJR220_001315 [Bradyrhizobium sp. LjRoot220]|uniref:hypothetical protein n=1 Tax=Bradyrhizobium sp. LjRoot220 TaxID=3342284 RepID=UPI003ECFDD7B